MRLLGPLLACWGLLSVVAHAACIVPSYNTFFGTPPGHVEADAFKGRFDYPAAPTEPLPAFMSIDFRADWKGYLWGALDAELAVWCEYRNAGDQTGGKIAGEGAIDIPPAREARKRIMEGGEAAFSLRREKYGF